MINDSDCELSQISYLLNVEDVVCTNMMPVAAVSGEAFVTVCFANRMHLIPTLPYTVFGKDEYLLNLYLIGY